VSGPALYELAADYRALAERLHDLDLPDDVIADTLDGESAALDEKLAAYGMVIRNLEHAADGKKALATSYTEQAAALTKRAAFLRGQVVNVMLALNKPKAGTAAMSLAVRENPASVVIDDASKVPTEFMRLPPPAPPPVAMPDKKAIGDALKAGLDIPGAHAERTIKLVLK
jgi:hypothetical protein